MGIISAIKKIAAGRTTPSAPTDSYSNFVNECSGLIATLTGRLTPLAADSEEKFLYIGSCLQDFFARSGELSEISASASKLISGEKIGITTERLEKELNVITGYLASNEKASINSIRKLREIFGVAAGLHDICSEFEKIANSLRFLCVSIRIESARLNRNDAGFDILSGNVKELANLIDAKSAGIQKDSKSLTAFVQKALERALELLEFQQGAAAKMLQETREDIESLTLLHDKSAKVSDKIAMRSSEIYNSIGEVVVSMQFHDILRQEMEHAGKDLMQLCETPEDPAAFDQTQAIYRQNEIAEQICNICGIQAGRLFHISDTLTKAVDRIIGNLRQISKNVKEMAIDTLALSGGTHQSGKTLLSQVEVRILAVIQLLGENAKQANEVSVSVGSAVKGMEGFIGEIEEISADIKLIALNAQVKATLAGSEGKTLGVIAEEVRALAINVKNHTADIFEKLRAIAAEAGATGDDPNSGQGKDTEGNEDMAAALRDLLNPLERINAGFISLLNKITESGQTLGDEIEYLSRQIVFHKDMSGNIEDIAGSLAGISAYFEQSFLPQAVYNGADNVRLRAIAGAAQIIKAPESPAAFSRQATFKNRNGCKPDCKSAEVLLGDNVELF